MSTQEASLPLSDRIQQMAESATIAMSQKARELRQEGKDVIALSLGEPDFNTPQHVCEAAKAAIDEGYSKYTPVPGYLELRQAICQKLERDNGLGYEPNQVVVSTGAKQSIANLALCLLNPGDEVVIFAPYWVSYIEIVKLAGGVPVPVEGAFANGLKVTAEQVEAAITPKTKAILYSSPCNPTGAVWSQEELQALAEVLERNPQVMAIADEIYEYINFKGQHASLAQFPEVKDQVVVVNGCSKGFAMTGWRIGYIAGPQYIAKACDKIQGQFTSGTNSIAQRAAIAAMTGDLEPTRQMATAYRQRRDIVLELLDEIPGFKTYVPEGAFYIFPDVTAFFGKSDGQSSIRSASDLALYILEEAHVSTVTGEAFGAPNNLRISFAASEKELREAMRRIKAVCAKLS